MALKNLPNPFQDCEKGQVVAWLGGVPTIALIRAMRARREHLSIELERCALDDKVKLEELRAVGARINEVDGVLRILAEAQSYVGD
jgi:hypothetical protein